jgi:succinyl-diaminopimelate desuccinylase
MKAGVAAMVVALERLAEAPHDGTVGLLLTSDEEGPGVDGTAHALGVLTSENVVIDAAIVGEPTSEQVFGDVVKNGRRGSMTGTIMVQGIQGHTAYPQLAKNAVHFAAPAITELAHLTWDNPIPAFPATTLQISGMKAGTGASNVIPGQCEVQFNIRFGMGQTVTEIQDQVAGVFASHGISDRIEWEVSALPFLTLPGPLVDAVARSIQAVTGVTPRGSTGGGTSDARFFATHDIPVIEFGPLNATIHAVNERVAISCLEPLAEIYRLTLVSLLT